MTFRTLIYDAMKTDLWRNEDLFMTWCKQIYDTMKTNLWRLEGKLMKFPIIFSHEVLVWGKIFDDSRGNSRYYGHINDVFFSFFRLLLVILLLIIMTIVWDTRVPMPTWPDVELHHKFLSFWADFFFFRIRFRISVHYFSDFIFNLEYIRGL